MHFLELMNAKLTFKPLFFINVSFISGKGSSDGKNPSFEESAKAINKVIQDSSILLNGKSLFQNKWNTSNKGRKKWSASFSK